MQPVQDQLAGVFWETEVAVALASWESQAPWVTFGTFLSSPPLPPPITQKLRMKTMGIRGRGRLPSSTSENC